MERPVSLMDFYNDCEHERLDQPFGFSRMRSMTALSS
jgi:hypothetical protein